MKVSIIIPIYYNADTLQTMYDDLKAKVLDVVDYECEIVMVNDGSKDDSWDVMRRIATEDSRVVTISLSRNFGSHAAILCGFEHCLGDCAVVKAADLQEPSELLLQMVERWKNGANVVLAARSGRHESASQTFFSNLYYKMVRCVAFPQMPEQGFDVFLVDRKVINVLSSLDETNSALTGQILWSGFRTDTVYYERLSRTVGKSRWTLKKKLGLVKDTLFSFSTLPITLVTVFGAVSCSVSLLWALWVLMAKLLGMISVTGWTTLFIFNLFSFGVTMMTLGIIGEYLWRAFDASRKRPPYIVEFENGEKTRGG